MSVSEFSTALKNKAINAWFQDEITAKGTSSASKREEYYLENVNVLTNATSIYRAKEQTADKTAFVITKDTIVDLIRELHGVTSDDEVKELSDVYFKSFSTKGVGAQVSRKKITLENGVPAVYFPKIGFDTITTLVNNIMNLKPKQLASKYEKGHVIGLNTELLDVTRSRLAKVDTTGSTGKAFLIKQLDKIIEYYSRLDLESANLQPASDIKLYASVNKSVSSKGQTRYLVELQPKEANQRSSDEVKATIGSVRKLFSSGALSEKAITSILEKLQASVTDKVFQQDLLDMKSSPSFKEMLGKAIRDTIAKTPGLQTFNHKNVLVATKKGKAPNLNKLRQEAKIELSKAKAVKAAISKPPRIRNLTTDRFQSFTALQTLINANLAQRIKENMGDGNRRDILNLRTGRLAESAKVERMSQSRAGMITAFYSYMKNPYATFSDGGKQQDPKSRDPKLLISKSIREIAAAQVGNRMRAVLV